MTHLLVQTTTGTASTLFDTLRTHPAVDRADLVSGPYDLVISLTDGDEADRLIEHFNSLADVLRVHPCRPGRTDVLSQPIAV